MKSFRTLPAILITFGALACAGEPGLVATGPDADGDGLDDDIERAGWTVTVDESGAGDLSERLVFSNPNVADTDGDGLTDGEEYAAKTDPGAKDTDLDQLDDFAEIRLYKSIPTNVDTDGDARGPSGDDVPNPSLYDGNELALSGTSPTLFDTDGDGLTDYEEITRGGFRPLVADLPKLELDVKGNPSITLNARFSGESGFESISSTMDRSASQSSRTDRQNTQTTIENSQKIATRAEVNYPWSASVSVEAKAEFKQGFFNETETSVSRSHARELQNDYSRAVNGREIVEYEDGEVQVAMQVKNDSQLTFRLKEFTLIAYRHDAAGLTLVSTLYPNLGSQTSTRGHLLPADAELTFVAKNDAVNYQAIQPLLANPTGLVFEVGTFSLAAIDEHGEETRDYAVITGHVAQQTGMVVLDFGDGRIERHLIATNVERRADGSAAGVSLRRILDDILEVDYATETNDAGVEVITRVRDRESRALDASEERRRAFWVVAGSGPRFDDGATNVTDLILRQGERISLVYVTDTDGDGVYDREERLVGANRHDADTDGDGLTDFEELKQGWTHHLSGDVVFSDPRAEDVDEDGLTDAAERELGTDPRDADTDGDGWLDGIDANPNALDHEPLIPAHGLAAHYALDASFIDAVSGTEAVEHAPANASWFQDRHGWEDSARYFNARRGPEGGWVNHAAGAAALPATGSFTVVAWYRPPAGEHGAWIAGQHQRGGIELAGGQPRFVVWDSASGVEHRAWASHRSLASDWYLVAGVYEVNGETSTLKLYLGAYGTSLELVAETKLRTVASANAACPVAIAARPYGDDCGAFSIHDHTARGAIDDVRLYDRALSEIELGQGLFYEAAN